MEDDNRSQNSSRTLQTPFERRDAMAVLPYSQPHVRTQVLPDYARKAIGMSYQPTMSVIQEESPPETILWLPPSDTHGALDVSPVSCYEAEDVLMPSLVEDREHEHLSRLIEPQQYANIGPTAVWPVWQARHVPGIISSQSTASHDENRKPSQESITSLPLFAPRAAAGIDIDALEAAARSSSVDLNPSSLSLDTPTVEPGTEAIETAQRTVCSETSKTTNPRDSHRALDTVRAQTVSQPLIFPHMTRWDLKILTVKSRQSTLPVRHLPAKIKDERPKPKQRRNVQPELIKTVSDAGQQTVVDRDGPIEVVSSNRYRMASADTETILSFDEEVTKIVVGTVASPMASSDVTNHIQTPRRHHPRAARVLLVSPFGGIRPFESCQ